MNELFYKIPGPDDNDICGRLCAEGNDRLIVHLHGLSHNVSHLLEVTSAEYFTAQGFDHYRLAFYDYPPKSRRLSNSSLSTHVRDTLAVLAHFQKAYKEIFVTAHSLSGLVLLAANPPGIKAMSLWDPSPDVKRFWESGPYLTPMPERQAYLMDYGNIFVISEEMVDEVNAFSGEKAIACARSIATPTQMLLAEQRLFFTRPELPPESFIKAFAGPTELETISKANHTFSLAGNREELFKATLRWFNLQSRLAS